MRYASYWLDFVSMPLLVFLIVPAPSVAAAALLLLGYALWIFAEYYLHRVVFHKMYRREHWKHHREPTDKSGAVSSLHSHAIALAVAVGSLVVFGPLGGALAAGLTLGYWQYIVLHHAIHHGWLSANGALGSIVRRHEMHHGGVEANFNFAIPLADILFGTYKRA